MIYRETKATELDRTGSAFRLASLIDRLATTDDPDDLVALHEAAEEQYADFGQYVVRIIDKANDLEATSEAITAEIKRLQELKAAREARAERLRKVVTDYMIQVGTSEVFTDLYTVRLKRNPPAVEIQHEAIVPAEYRRTVIKETETIDKKAIAEALKLGLPVDGCALVTRYRLEIK